MHSSHLVYLQSLTMWPHLNHSSRWGNDSTQWLYILSFNVCDYITLWWQRLGILLINAVWMKYRAHNSPHTQCILNTNIYFMEWNNVYKIWISCASVHIVLCTHVKIKWNIVWKNINVRPIPPCKVTEDTTYRNHQSHGCKEHITVVLLRTNFSILFRSLWTFIAIPISCAMHLTGLQGNIFKYCLTFTNTLMYKILASY